MSVSGVRGASSAVGGRRCEHFRAKPKMPNKNHLEDTDALANNKRSMAKDRNWVLIAIAFIGQIFVFLNRYTCTKAFDGTNVFELALASLHIVILAPAAVAMHGLEPTHCLKSRKRALLTMALMSMVQHWVALIGAFLAADGWRTFPKQLFFGLFINRCQFSIAMDGVFAHFQSHIFHRIDQPRDSLVDTCYALLFSPAAMYAIRSIPTEQSFFTMATMKPAKKTTTKKTRTTT